MDMILNEEQSSGNYQFSFSTNNKLNEGMYIVRLTIDGKSFSQKVINN